MSRRRSARISLKDLPGDNSLQVNPPTIIEPQPTTSSPNEASDPASNEKPKRGRKKSVVTAPKKPIQGAPAPPDTSSISEKTMAILGADDRSVQQKITCGGASTVSHHGLSHAEDGSKLTRTYSMNLQVDIGEDSHSKRTRNPSMRPKTTLHPGLPDMPKPKRTHAEVVTESRRKKERQEKLEELRKSIAEMEADEEKEKAEEEANRVRCLDDVQGNLETMTKDPTDHSVSNFIDEDDRNEFSEMEIDEEATVHVDIKKVSVFLNSR